ncbi:amino acid adenylation domain-containing protein [Catellatospora tritici]|uniref:amino acid adenylation domain-containing protein n=1 Tax=Catellatospora tritici TaxID=2851566 RepID=UPI001C2D7391|nr:amino acid adenylation domain-containing protein [Catellatospora tritici]MBV1855862.1 amino acid adenylation domain-containing protein [Catellatospora tritici]
METVWDLVREQAERTPDEPAAVGVQEYSYRDLAQRAEALAALIRRVAEPGSLLALETSSPVSGAIAFLAGAQAGCAILPMNLESPPAHRQLILDDARPAAVVRAPQEAVFTVDSLGTMPAADTAGRDLHDMAYVMYTSGSTGRPKGVIVSHDSLASRIRALARVPGMRAGETILAMTALSFDISLAEMLVPLTVGAKFVAVPVEARTDPDAFAELLKLHSPDVIQATPSFWRLLLAAGDEDLSYRCRVWCGGEALTPSLAAALLTRSTELWNLYGPTEATIWATAARIERPDAISLGDPLQGCGLFLDEGEIFLYGEGLASGYLGRPETTAERFSVRTTPQGPALTYRTGDRGRWAADGSLEYLGRVDAQIKLRGHRIELGEVESVIEEHPAVTEAAVLVRHADRPERAFMVAFVVTREDLTAEALNTWIRTRLPASYCPSMTRFVPSLPRNSSGKIDRAGLAGADL